MISEPKLEKRDVQHYVGIRSLAAMHEFPTLIPQQIGEVVAWLGTRGIQPSGAPFIRYHVINMADKLDVEVGWPVAKAISGNGRIQAGTLPAGRYATLIYTGDYPGLMEANAALLYWGAQEGILWDCWEAENGDAFGARFETYLTDPAEESDPAKWETEVAIMLADGQG